jgi:hypothetical protein
MLYKENLIPYDRNTLSNWSQMKGMCVNGEMIGYEAEQVTLISSTFGMIRRAYPDAMVLNHEACGEGICKDLKSGNDFGEPDETVKLPSGSSHFGIAKEENLLLFDMDLFNDSIETYNAVFRGQRFLVIGHSNNQYFAAFMYNESISGDYYEPIQNSMPMVMRDKLGNYYDLFGNITVGPEKGNRLLSPNAYFAHNFAWQALFQGIEIYNE